MLEAVLEVILAVERQRCRWWSLFWYFLGKTLRCCYTSYLIPQRATYFNVCVNDDTITSRIRRSTWYFGRYLIVGILSSSNVTTVSCKPSYNITNKYHQFTDNSADEINTARHSLKKKHELHQFRTSPASSHVWRNNRALGDSLHFIIRRYSSRSTQR